MRGIWRFVGLLVAIWAIAGAVIFWTRASRPTPQSLARYIDTHVLENRSPAEREKILTETARQLNRLTFEQRQEFRSTRTDRRFFEQMTPEERARFLDLTLPEGFRQLMTALNTMEPEQRKKIVQRALDDMERESPGLNDRIDQEAAQKILSQGMETFYKEASSEVKLDFAPVIESLQRTTQGLR
jgi:hypothetical protein